MAPSHLTERRKISITMIGSHVRAGQIGVSMAKKLTAAEIEALQASWAWKVARPFYKVEREMRRWQRRRREGRPSKAASLEQLRQSISVDFDALKAAYFASPVSAEPDSFALYRILGNDLPPRHRKGQTRSNLGLILAHEPQFQDCEKRWILNRIYDSEEEARIIDLLERSGQSYTRIPFDLAEYGSIGWEANGFKREGFFLDEAFARLGDDTKLRAEVHARRVKNLYVMNNNGGRNVALREGRSLAKWILPWDGNCFVTASAWRALRKAVVEQAYLKYFVVPMLRASTNEMLLRDQELPPAEDEPQLIFRRDATEMFDEAFPYGVRPKVELLWRLGVSGVWNSWERDPWDLPAPSLSADAGQFASAGWVGRLESGRPELERGTNSDTMRYVSRAAGIVIALDALDARAIAERYRPEALALYDAARLRRLADVPTAALAIALKADAEEALLRGPYSVTDKPRPAPSGNPHDYLSLARYWWPDPSTPDGRPFRRRDGEDVFSAGLPDFAADQFDRDRVQSFSDDVIMLALAGSALSERRYLERAAELVRAWFLDPQTRMAPHLRFAQVTRGHNNDENSGSGVLDLACIAPLLDAVRLIETAGLLDGTERQAFRNWLRAYLDWLHASPQGRHACSAHNNHGTFFDVQVLAIAGFLGDGAELATTLRRARERIPHHFAVDGSQPHEIERTRPKHYSRYNLVAWTLAARLAEAVGDGLWTYRTASGRGIERGLDFVLDESHQTQDWREEADAAPLLPLRIAHRERFGDSGGEAHLEVAVEDRFLPRSGLPPYWQLLR
ncbi:alginate lyase family protein [Kaistia adipata]|uniref:alginate lyase family protein n=1 Tax=Kaistia adipata TaxID=166954 RepID=UPI0009FC531A|nr:alginate lyase family protein [Kaistia adipata]